MLSRFLDWLDEAAGGLIRVTYLLAGITADAVYFGAGHLPRVIEDPLNGALPWLLGFSLETHTYLTARRVRAAWQDHERTALKVQLSVLGGLLAFSAWNQLQYLSLTWQPPQAGALALPTWAAFLVRALIVPAAFMAAAFLAPLAEPVTAQIEAEARATLADVFKIARKQRRRMLKRAEADGRDMTGALVELVPDPDVRRIISHAYGAIRAPLMDTITPAIAAPALPEPPTRAQDDLQPVSEPETMQVPSPPPVATPARAQSDDDPPPTPPSTPRSSKRPRKRRASKRAPVLRLQPVDTAEQRIRTALADNPTLSIRQLAKQAAVSESTASKYARLVRSEKEQRAAQ